jgi:predicted secreted Zn-dependent protease
MTRKLTIALISLLLLAAPALADVVRTVHSEYYTVQGTNKAEIYNDLRHNSPLNKGDETYQAHTRTSIRTTYKILQRGNQCQIKDVVVHLDLTYLYPKLLHSVDYETRTWWKDFYGQLEEHELIHGEISSKAAHRLDDILENLGPGDCGGYKNIIKVKIKQVMDRMKQDQAAYDKLVEHGLKQDRNMGRYP